MAILYFAWFRDSSFVAVRDVKVEGVTGSDRAAIASALTRAAHGMTTLDVGTDKLRSAVSGYPTVASVSADPSFPHGLTIHVAERQPALLASDGKRQVPVGADGLLLPGVKVAAKLPVLRVDALPSSGRLGGEALPEALALGAAPAPLRPLVAGASMTRAYGIVVTLRGGITLRFGMAADPAAQWAAAAAVLADPRVTSLSYVDLRVAERPAVGG